jgi:hypothetical protein
MVCLFQRAVRIAPLQLHLQAYNRAKEQYIIAVE